MQTLRYTLWAFENWLLSVDSHHDDRRNTPTGYFTSLGILNLVDSDGNAPSLAGCKPTVRLLHYEPIETGGPCGLRSRDLPLDKRLL